MYCTVVRQWRFIVHGFKVPSRQYRRATPLLLTIQRWSMLSFWFPYCHAHTHTNRKSQHFFHNKLPFESWCVKQRMSSKDKETRGQAGVVDRVLESKHVERTSLLWRDFFFSFLGRHDRCFLCKINEWISYESKIRTVRVDLIICKCSCSSYHTVYSAHIVHLL